MKRVLIITYYWPPGGGAGVQRWLKFSRYLPLYGIEPLILTVDPDYATYPATDRTLENEVPEEIEVFRTRATDYFRLFSKDKSVVPTAGFARPEKRGFAGKIARFVRGNLFIPDPRRGWNRFAFRKGCSLIREREISTVITTGPPHSTHLTGMKLKKRFPEIKWIADFRDPWTEIYYYSMFSHTPPARWLDRQYELSVLRRADMVLSVGEKLSSMLSGKLPDPTGKIRTVTNGYDPADFSGIVPTTPPLFTITYTGTLAASYRIEGLTAALKALSARGIKFIIQFTGIIEEGQRALLESSLPADSLSFRSYISHREALQEMAEASVLLLIIPDHPGNDVIITGKLFEYLATGKPILCIAPPDGDAALIVQQRDNSHVALYHDSDSIAAFLKMAADGRIGNRDPLQPDYSRKSGAGKVADLIRSLTKSPS